MFEKEKEGLIEVHNVYEIAPADGTIIGMATEEEMEIAAELESAVLCPFSFARSKYSVRRFLL